MKKKFVAIMMVAAMAASMAACGSDGGSSDTQKGGSSTTTSDVANKDKPLVWFNRQPSNSSTGELDTTALNYNKDTYYVGFDANQGAELQGEMVKEYIEKNIDTIDRNGDGVIGKPHGKPCRHNGIAVGADGIFIETHADPRCAKSDGANMLRLDLIEGLLERLVRVREAIR